MALGEFELIDRFFRQPAEAARIARGDVVLGIGDDGAVLDLPAGRQLVAVLDTLVEGRHFPPGSPPESIGHRALAVNLSDLAAMGAEPAWFLLSLSLPEVDAAFLERFADGLLTLAAGHRIALVGGDTTAGSLTVSVTALGLVDAPRVLHRAGARAGDLLYVSGSPGDATAGLSLAMGEEAPGIDAAQRQWLLDRFHFPTPRVQLGQALAGLASACIDVSDGLAADAGKLAHASGCGVCIETDRLPLSVALRAHSGALATQRALCGGDDYELCFTVPPERADELASRLADVQCAVTCIGRIEPGTAVRALAGGVPVPFALHGHDHFPAR